MFFGNGTTAASTSRSTCRLSCSFAAGDDHGQRRPVIVHQHESRRAFSFVAVGDQFAPFFAGQNVPSAMSWLQSIQPSSSASSTSRDQTSVKIPVRRPLGESSA